MTTGNPNTAGVNDLGSTDCVGMLHITASKEQSDGRYSRTQSTQPQLYPLLSPHQTWHDKDKQQIPGFIYNRSLLTYFCLTLNHTCTLEKSTCLGDKCLQLTLWENLFFKKFHFNAYYFCTENCSHHLDTSHLIAKTTEAFSRAARAGPRDCEAKAQSENVLCPPSPILLQLWEATITSTVDIPSDTLLSYFWHILKHTPESLFYRWS